MDTPTLTETDELHIKNSVLTRKNLVMEIEILTQQAGKIPALQNDLRKANTEANALEKRLEKPGFVLIFRDEKWQYVVKPPETKPARTSHGARKPFKKEQK